MPADYTFQIDWNGNGDFSDTGDDVTQRTLARNEVTIQYGRDQQRALSPMAFGEASFEIDNTSRDYSPENPSSPLAGNVRPGRPVLFEGTLTPDTYTLFRGFLDDYEVLPDIQNRSVRMTAVDAMARLKDVKISTPVFQGLRTGQAVGLVLDAIGWPEDKRDLDEGATTVRWWWEEGTDAWTALEKIVTSEGPGARVTVDVSGAMVFRDRHHRITRTRSLVSQATFRDTGTEPVFSAPLSYDHGWRDIVNQVTFSVEERQQDDTAVVWSSDDSYNLSDGQALTLTAQASDPFRFASTPVVGEDVILRSGAVDVSLSRTSGQTTTITIRATGGPASVQSVQLRARPLTVHRTVVVSAFDSTSAADFGTRDFPYEAPWASVHDAQAIANIILAQRAQRLPIVTMRIVGGDGNDARLAVALGRDLSDRVTIIEPETGLDADFWVEQIGHSISEAGLMHEVTLGCEKIPLNPTSVFTFDVTGRGFDDGTFGALGLDDPSLVFRFDHATQGRFNVGVFGT